MPGSPPVVPTTGGNAVWSLSQAEPVRPLTSVNAPSPRRRSRRGLVSGPKSAPPARQGCSPVGPIGTATLTSIHARAAALIDLHQCDLRADGLSLKGQPQE